MNQPLPLKHPWSHHLWVRPGRAVVGDNHNLHCLASAHLLTLYLLTRPRSDLTIPLLRRLRQIFYEDHYYPNWDEEDRQRIPAHNNTSNVWHLIYSLSQLTEKSTLLGISPNINDMPSWSGTTAFLMVGKWLASNERESAGRTRMCRLGFLPRPSLTTKLQNFGAGERSCMTWRCWTSGSLTF
jgi:hypothetical protein